MLREPARRPNGRVRADGGDLRRDRRTENILTGEEQALVARGAASEVVDGRVAFQADTEDEFTAAVERLTNRHVVAFLSANQARPGIACELFFLDAAPLAG